MANKCLFDQLSMCARAAKCREVCEGECENEWVQIVLMYGVAFKAWLVGALGFSKVPTTRTRAPAVPVCGWWAKGNADGVWGTNMFLFMPCLPGWALGTNQCCSAMPMLT